MACFPDRRAACVALLASVLSGCVSGHLLDAARRRERPLAVTGATLDRDRVVLRYTAEITDDAGAVLETTTATAALPLTALRAAASPAADAVAPVWDVETRGTPNGLGHGAPPAPAGAAPPGPTLVVLREDGRDSALVWHDVPGTAAFAPVPAATLTRLHTAPWAWPLLPATLAFDAATVPVLVLFAPAMMALGE
jgi:hypothetical protein